MSTLRLVSKHSRSSDNMGFYFVLRKFERSYDASKNLCWTVRAWILRSRFFLEYHPSSSNIPRCQDQSRVKAWFYDSSGDWILITSYPYFVWKVDGGFLCNSVCSCLLLTYFGAKYSFYLSTTSYKGTYWEQI